MNNKKKYSTRDRLENSARNLFYGTAAFSPLRSCYQTLFNPQKLARRRRMCDFYAPFVHRGDVVFDVGANVGHYSEMFSELGARVVAVEPNPRCCENLRKLAHARQVYVEECAVGDVAGKASLRICESSTLSTLTDRWYDMSKMSQPLQDVTWLGEIEVDVITLDQLADRYGVPSFVKIDVEGYDDRVLRGMSFQPPAFSFEFSRLAPDVAMRCLEMPTLAGRYQYNYMPETKMQLAWEFWIPVDEARERLATNASDEDFGDVLARRIA